VRLAALVSGGKDSLSAMYRVMGQGHEVVCLLNVQPEREDSWMFHHPNTHLVELQAEALGIELVRERSSGVKERELEDLRRLFERVADRVEGVVTGALASRYQRERIERIASELGLEVVSPLWGMEPLKHWRWLLEKGFVVMLTAVSAEGLGKEWLGRVVGEAELRELAELAERYRFHLGFEGGEAETLVLDMPAFSSRLEVVEAERVWHGSSGVYVVRRARLVSKGKGGGVRSS